MRCSLFSILLAASSLSTASAFVPSSRSLVVTPKIVVQSRTTSTPVLTGMAEDVEQEMNEYVNKNKKGYQLDMEERSERMSLDITKTTYASLVKAAPDAYITFAEKGASNAHLPKRKIFHQSVLGGCYVGFGGMISLAIAGNLGGLTSMNPGIAKMTFAALFPVNLLLIVSTQGQLFTGNSATVAAARYEGFVSTKDVINSWAISLLGNIVGCGLFAAVSMAANIVNPGASAMAISTAVGKCTAGFVPVFLRSILCNWMVSMAVFLSGAANDLTGKMVGCWFPISTFVGIGLEHSVANMFILPLALMCGAPLTLSDIIFKNLIPVIIGNGIAGAIIVAASYSYQFGRLGGLRRAIFKEKLENMRKELARQRAAAERQLKEEVKEALSD